MRVELSFPTPISLGAAFRCFVVKQDSVFAVLSDCRLFHIHGFGRGNCICAAKGALRGRVPALYISSLLRRDDWAYPSHRICTSLHHAAFSHGIRGRFVHSARRPFDFL